MKTDAYTKSLLTVIAACLLWLSAQAYLWPPAVNAQRLGPQEVVIVGVRMPRYRGAGLPVEIISGPVEVSGSVQVAGGLIEIDGQPIQVQVSR